MTSKAPVRHRSAAERMRLSRLRRRDGIRCIQFEVRDTEIGALVMHGLVVPADCNNRNAIARALLPEQIPKLL